MRVSVDTTLSLLGMTDVTRKPSMKHYINLNFRLRLAPVRAVSDVLRGVFTWYCSAFYCISAYVVTFGNFRFNGSLNMFVTSSLITSESQEIWQFKSLESRGLTTRSAQTPMQHISKYCTTHQKLPLLNTFI
jgi:hypothetical protein